MQIFVLILIDLVFINESDELIYLGPVCRRQPPGRGLPYAAVREARMADMQQEKGLRRGNCQTCSVGAACLLR